MGTLRFDVASAADLARLELGRPSDRPGLLCSRLVRDRSTPATRGPDFKGEGFIVRHGRLKESPNNKVPRLDFSSTLGRPGEAGPGGPGRAGAVTERDIGRGAKFMSRTSPAAPPVSRDSPLDSDMRLWSPKYASRILSEWRRLVTGEARGALSPR